MSAARNWPLTLCGCFEYRDLEGKQRWFPGFCPQAMLWEDNLNNVPSRLYDASLMHMLPPKHTNATQNSTQIDASFHRLRHRTVPPGEMRAVNPYNDMQMNRNLNAPPFIAVNVNNNECADNLNNGILPRPFVPLRRKGSPTERDHDKSYLMEKPLLEAPVQKPVALKSSFHDPPMAEAHDSNVFGIRGSKPIVHFGGCTVKKLSSPDSNSETSSSTAFSSVGKQQQQQQQHPRRDRDREKGDVDVKASDSSSVNTTQDSASIASHLAIAMNNPTASITTTTPSIPKVDFDDLCLQHVVGGGGFGQVWQGTWMGTPVAIKMILMPKDSSASAQFDTEAFQAEVSMLCQLRHPHICLILGACIDNSHRAIVTELMSRGSLWDALRRRDLFKDESSSGNSGSGGGKGGDHSSNWPVWAMKRVLEGTCRALIYLHSHSPPIMHRDLKSPNLLLDDSLNVKVCDFGLAKLRDINCVMTANVGTVQWMAPEVLTGQQYSEAADIYSLGIIMWELFTGECPHSNLTQLEIAAAVAQRHERPYTPVRCSLGQAQLMERCWAANPAQRLSGKDLLPLISASYS